MNLWKLSNDVSHVSQKKINFFCETFLFSVNSRQLTAKYLITIFIFFSKFSFSQVYVSSGSDFHISHISDTFYSEFSYVDLSSDISGEGVLHLSNIDSLATDNSPFVSNLVVSESTVYLSGDIICCNILKLDNSYLHFTSGRFKDLYEVMDSIVLNSMSSIDRMNNLSYEELTSNTWYSNEYLPLFFYCNNFICSTKGIDNTLELLGETTLYSSISLQVPTPPP